MRSLPAAVVVLLLLLAPVAVTGAETSSLPVFQPDECMVDVPAAYSDIVSCGWLTTHLWHDNPTAGKVVLPVVQMASTDPNPPADPIIFLDGGPGSDATRMIDYFLDSALRDSRDIILIGQRGTEFARPSLNCPEYDYDVEDPLSMCRSRLASDGVDLAAFNSAESAADVADLVTALGLDVVNLYGSSYGTRLALTVLRDHPERIRSVILEAVSPPEVEALEDSTINTAAAFDRLFEQCTADPACTAAFPKLEGRTYALIDALNRQPASLYDPYYEEYFDFTGDDLIFLLFEVFYDVQSIPMMPLWITDAEAGNFEALTDYMFWFSSDGSDNTDISDAEWDKAVMQYLNLGSVDELNSYLNQLTNEEYVALEIAVFADVWRGNDSDSEGLYMSIYCVEELPFNDPQRAAQRAMNVNPRISNANMDYVNTFYDECAIWNVSPAPLIEDAPVVSDVPVLLLSGEFDPITPPNWGDVAARSLSRSYHYVLPGMGHGSIDLHECPTAVALDFVADPTTPPDASCVQTMPPVSFYAPQNP